MLKISSETADALEQAEQAQLTRNVRFATDLLLVYGTAEEYAGTSAIDRATVEMVLDQVYSDQV